MKREDLIKKYLEFFKEKGHKEVPNSSLVPENDPTVLFTTAGMHPLVPFLIGQKHPLGKKLVGIQRCIRTRDIDEVGDSTHHTFFKMLGNWSLGDYFKSEAIEYSFEFLTKILKIPIEKIAVSVFEGDKDSPKDLESARKWEDLGIPKERIASLPKKNNWWDPAGLTGPCGPDTEMFYWRVKEKTPKKFDPTNENWIEIWNDVLMQYTKNDEGNYMEAKQKNIDTGMGLERTIAVLNGLDDNYLSEIWQPLIKKIEKISRKEYSQNKKEMRIIADHLKASAFIISDGVLPNNTERGYVLRRLIRRAIRQIKNLSENKISIVEIIKPVFKIYPEYNLDEKLILKELKNEEAKFSLTIENGLKKFEKFVENKKELSGEESFLLYQSYGFPIELIEEECKSKKINFKREEFLKEYEKHQKLSQTASSGKFKSGLIDDSVETTRLHTATHLLNEALRQILKDKNLVQKGSNITSERLRFDFNFSRKLTNEEIKKVEEWINEKIKKGFNVKKEEMSLKKAIDSGAQAEFGTKYPERVSVYTIYDEKDPKNFISKELCTGPHVKDISELGKFKILKEESSSLGIRRIKAILE